MYAIRKVGIWGPALLVAFLLSGIAAASAPASTPTFEAEDGTVEGVEFAIGGNGGAMETVGESRVDCTGTTGSGEIVSNTRVLVNELRFTGCTSGIATCTTDGEPSGNILTEPGNAGLRYIGPNDDIAALWVWPQSGKGEVLAEFSCTFFGIGPDVTAFATAGDDAPDGGFVCPVTPENEFTTTSTVECGQEKGVADFKTFADPETCDPVQDWFESEGVGTQGWGRQESALEGDVTNTTTEPVRINSTECV